MIKLSNTKIPAGCTHWVKNPDFNGVKGKYKFYKVYGVDLEIIFIWFRNKWTKFEVFQQYVHDATRTGIIPKIPPFNNGFFNRAALTANDKLKAIGERL